ncbi:MAG: glycine cleavage system protein R [Marmoricola sp.]
MSQLAITVLGHDRPGIIAATTHALADLGVNIEDSSMTLLRGHFAMTLVTDGHVSVDQATSALAFLESDGTLTVTVREMPDEDEVDRGTPFVLSVHGGDRPGIVARIVGEVAQAGGNVTDLSTRLAGGLYVLIAECDFPEATDIAAVHAAISAAANELGVAASLRAVESDDL